MPTNCSVEMLAAINEKPISRQLKPRPARRYDSLSFSGRLLRMPTDTTEPMNSTKPRHPGLDVDSLIAISLEGG